MLRAALARLAATFLAKTLSEVGQTAAAAVDIGVGLLHAHGKPFGPRRAKKDRFNYHQMETGKLNTRKDDLQWNN